MSEDDDAICGLRYFNFRDDILSEKDEQTNDVTPPVPNISITDLMAKSYSNSHLTYIGNLHFPISGKPIFFALHAFEENAIELTAWLDLLQKVADKYHSHIRFIIGDDTHISLVDPLFVFCTNYFNKMEPPNMYAVDRKGRKFKYTGNVTVESLLEYCKLFLEGKLYKSEPLPLNRKDSILKTCVADNFNELVTKSNVDVLLVFYTDWCMYSQELMPLLDELSEILKDDKMCIVKINPEKNYIPLEYNIFCYPIIYLIRSDNKRTTVDYQVGPRTIENLIKFIAANCFDELINYDRFGNYKY